MYQFAQMAGNMTIKGAKHEIDNVVGRIFSKNRCLVYKFNNRGRNSNALFVFDTGFKFHGGRERIFAYTLKNTRQDKREQQYYGLFIERETMMRDIVCSRQRRWHIGDIAFDNVDEMNALLTRLSDEALNENWRFSNYNSKISHPILKNYLENTYFQLVHQGKIYANIEEEKMMLNTGLIDASFNELFLVCDIVPNSARDGLFRQEYRNPEVYKSSSRVFCNYSRNTQLQMATFYDDPGDLLFNWEVAQQPGGINIADEHIFIDNMDRINQGLRDASIRFDFSSTQDVARCRQLFEGALKSSLEMSKRNYKFVAPQFWPATGKLQFLMPIYLEGVQELRKGDIREVLPPTVALSMEMSHEQYIGTTILTLDMAYQNARLIARPDGFWLDAAKIFAPKNDDFSE